MFRSMDSTVPAYEECRDALNKRFPTSIFNVPVDGFQQCADGYKKHFLDMSSNLPEEGNNQGKIEFNKQQATHLLGTNLTECVGYDFESTVENSRTPSISGSHHSCDFSSVSGLSGVSFHTADLGLAGLVANSTPLEPLSRDEIINRWDNDWRVIRPPVGSQFYKTPSPVAPLSHDPFTKKYSPIPSPYDIAFAKTPSRGAPVSHRTFTKKNSPDAILSHLGFAKTRSSVVPQFGDDITKSPATTVGPASVVTVVPYVVPQTYATVSSAAGPGDVDLNTVKAEKQGNQKKGNQRTRARRSSKNDGKKNARGRNEVSPVTDSSHDTTDAGKPVIYYNAAGKRIDPKLNRNKGQVEAMKHQKLCNIHYLRGECRFGAKCTHGHGKVLSEHDIGTLKIVARLAPCAKGVECKDFTCIYGHMCPTAKNDKGKTTCAFGGNCKFPVEMHHNDRKHACKLVQE